MKRAVREDSEIKTEKQGGREWNWDIKWITGRDRWRTGGSGENKIWAERERSWIQTQWLTSNCRHRERRHTQKICQQNEAYIHRQTWFLPPTTHTHGRSKCHQRFPPLTFCTRRQTTGKHKHGRLPRATPSWPETETHTTIRTVICISAVSTLLCVLKWMHA